MKNHYYQLFQPTRLQELACNKISKWITSIAAENINPITNPNDFDAAIKAEYILTTEIEAFQYYFRKTPGPIQCQLFKNLIVYLSDLLAKIFPKTGREDLTEPFHQRHVTDRMLEIFYTKNLTVLTLTYGEMYVFYESLCAKANKLTGLTKLTLDIEFGFPDQRNMGPKICQFLKPLRSLQFLSVKTCTREILEIIVENCKQIEHLELYNFIVMTPEVINGLIHLPNLKHIDLYDAWLYPSEMSFKRINHRKKQIIKQIKPHTKFQIKSLSHDIVDTLEVLELVVHEYPQITHLVLAHSHADTTLEAYINLVKDMEYLQELEIYSYEFYGGHVKDLLEVVGKKVIKLKLWYVDEIDLNALKYISLVCPYLQSLHILWSDYSNETINEDLIPLKTMIPPFSNLKEIVVLSEYDESNSIDEASLVGFLLSSSPNVESIELNDIHLSEEVMLEVLNKNPMHQLSKISTSDAFSSKVLNRIIEDCNSTIVMVHNGAGRQN